MVSVDEMVAIATALPNVTEGSRWGMRTWMIGTKGFAWERPFSKADVKRFGANPTPSGPIVALAVEDLNAKESVLSAAPKGVFTIAHFDGFAAVLVQLDVVTKRTLQRLLEDAWLACAPQQMADAYVASQKSPTNPSARKSKSVPRMLEPIDRLRALCMALPDVVERISHGEPTFFVQGKKAFVMTVDDHHGDGNRGFWCAAPPGAQAAMVADDPSRFFRPPYVGGRGWIGVRFDDRATDWNEITDIVEQAYRCVAPKGLLGRLDNPDPSSEPPG